MVIKTIKYEDYNGNVREEKFHFNLNQAELMEMEASKNGGLSTYIQRIAEEQDAPKIMELFKELLQKSYGVKSDDGKRFIKSKELTEAFIQTEAYSELFVLLASDADEATAFINGIVPKKLAGK